MAMHSGEEVCEQASAAEGGRLAGVDALAASAHCQSSKQPEFEHAAVKVGEADLGWHLLAVAWLPGQ